MRSIVKESSRVTWILFVIYALSFMLPALSRDVYGWQAFLMGLIYCWVLPWTIAWWANVLFWIGLCSLSIHAYGKAAAFGLIAFLLGLSFVGTGGGEHPQAGYYVWIGSMAGLFVAALGKGCQAEAAAAQFAPLVRRRSTGLKSISFHHQPCEQIVAGPPHQFADYHIREEVG